MSSGLLRSADGNAIVSVSEAFADANKKSQAVNTAAAIVKKQVLGLPGHEQYDHDTVTAARAFLALVSSALIDQATSDDALSASSSPYLPSAPSPIRQTKLKSEQLRRMARLHARLTRDEVLDDDDLASLDTVVREVGVAAEDVFRELIHR